MANRTKFTPEKRQQFLAALREFPNVSEAARSINLSRVALYEYRANDPEFASEWDAAIDEGIEKVEATALRRGVATSDTLLIFMLKAYRPEKYRENVRHELTGANGGAIQIDINDITNMSDDDLHNIVTG